MEEVVWLNWERKYAFLVQCNAFYSVVRYREGGIEREIEVENDDYILWKDKAITYESD